MSTNRREFLKGTAWMGAAAVMGGCASETFKFGGNGSMTGFAVPALKKVRVGVIGLGMRGSPAVHRLASIPGVEVAALCDLYQERIDRQQKWLKDQKKPTAREYAGEDQWKALCESDLDVVYLTTPWLWHTPMAVYAMEHGKHAMVEVPSALTIDECWQCVETSERTGKYCMQLENCCYGEAEMFNLNIVRQGILGEIMHAEGAYLHDLRGLNYGDPAQGSYQGYWRLKYNVPHQGNVYPTHGLVPVMQAMNINRGDRFDYLNCIQCDQRCMTEFAKDKMGAESWQARLNPECGDMSTIVIRTVKGKSLMIQHDVNSPHPYSRINLLQGTKGVVRGINFADKAESYVTDLDSVHLAWEEKVGDGAGHKYFDLKKTLELREKYKHPMWKTMGDIAKKVGGHGGMDFIMDLRWAYCMQNGLPLDMDVYDLAASCSLIELSEKSCRDRGNSQDVPDFTRGGWETAKPLGIEEIDVKKMGALDAKKDDAALNV